jgi:L-histidine N-alpha-methyltransferase
VARWNAPDEWIEMRLRARDRVRVAVPALDLEVAFEAGEEMRTEISAKFTPTRIRGDFAAAGLELVEMFTDADELFALSLARPAP